MTGNVVKLTLLLIPILALACSSDSGGDGGNDSGGATTEPTTGTADTTVDPTIDPGTDDTAAESGESGSDSGSTGGGPTPELPSVDGVEFVDVIDNPYLPFPVGATWVIEAMTDEGLEVISIEVTADTREIQGVTATVVRDTVTLDGQVIEDTYDWFAQDTEGNVWYLGEDTCEFEGGVCVDMVGAWEWGVDGALPGIVMPADPVIGEPFYQEYYIGEAEDFATIVEIGISVTVPAGTFDDCLKTHEQSTLDLNLDEYKYYCRGVGNVLVEEEDVREELTEYDIP